MTTTKILSGVFAAIAFLGGCTSMQSPPMQVSASPCAVHEYSFACQVERYQRVP
jgi:PBP1b-binding outer membrane lipoprotein LpoB